MFPIMYVKKIPLILLLIIISNSAFAQPVLHKVIDADTKTPVGSATVSIGNQTLITDADGSFITDSVIGLIKISCIGYKPLITNNTVIYIAMKRDDDVLKEIVVTANRVSTSRKEAPIAIASISKQTIDDTKAQRMDFLLNKVSGVFMVNLGNEQHQMSIRQPMTTKSLFLYMEDGIPLRTTGVYNHNALLELNIPAAASIEVIKGPSSALYGAEAIGGAVNVITQPAPVIGNGQISMQLNNNAYKRIDFKYGNTVNKWGAIVSGYHAYKQNGAIEFSDFNKTAITFRTDFKFSKNALWTNTLSVVDYKSDMSGSIDSLKFATRNYTSQQTFTYRNVFSLRYKSILKNEWNTNSTTLVTFMYRNNSIKQNPSYAIASTSMPTKFKGQINENAFNTYALFINHVQVLPVLKSRIVAGASFDFSPQNFYAKFIWVTKDVELNKFVSYTKIDPDSLLSKYKTGIYNIAGYVNYELCLIKNTKLTSAIRYDIFQYHFTNNLPLSTSISTASTINFFKKITPKIGLTYNKNALGFYANFSQGYVPPQLTELYSSIKVAPYLLPQSFNNYEVGGWLGLWGKKIYIDWSIYQLMGFNEIISVRQPDNTSINENAGSTKHTGIEYTIIYKPTHDFLWRFSGTNVKHVFIKNVTRGIDYNGKEMSGAPRFVANTEAVYRPFYLKGLRASVEWQYVSRYYMDDLNKYRYKGFNTINFRTGYVLKKFEMWVNILNVANAYYSTYSSKNSNAVGSASYAYNLGDPREITIGIGYNIGK